MALIFLPVTVFAEYPALTAVVLIMLVSAAAWALVGWALGLWR